MTDARSPANGQPANSSETRGWPRPDTASPAGWYLSTGGEAAPSLGPGTEPARSDDTVATALMPWSWGLPRQIRVAGPTERVPVAVSPPTTRVGPAPLGAAAPDPAGCSGWQLSHQAWLKSGIDWELPVDDQAAEDQARPARAHGDEQGLLAGEDYLGIEPSFAAIPLGAPVTAATRVPGGDERLPLRTRAGAGAASPGGTDELFRAWQGSVRTAAAPGRWEAGAAPWRHRAWQAARIGVPAAVIVAVGAGALVMLTGSANDVLASRASTGSQSRGAAAATAAARGGMGTGRVLPAGPAPVALAGYPGQRGAVSARSIWSAAGVTVAVGTADGHPAVWRHASGTAGAVGAASSAWTLESASLLGAGAGDLAMVTHGPAGWIAVGSVVAGGATEPAVLTSRNGVTWQPVLSLTELAGPGTQFLGVAATRAGYVVVGRTMTGGRTFAGLWWSTDLRTWTAGDNGGLDGRLAASTVNAVAATGNGFVAVGSHGAFPAVWTSSDGRHWSLRDLPQPPGARSATLRVVASRTSGAGGTNGAGGTRVVAGGYAATPAGDVPAIVTSADGGASWHQVVLGASGVVTALTAAGDGFIAAGLSGTVGAQHAVVWTSPDGLAWSAPMPAPAGDGEITVLDPAGAGAAATVTGIAQRAAGPAVVTLQLP